MICCVEDVAYSVMNLICAASNPHCNLIKIKVFDLTQAVNSLRVVIVERFGGGSTFKERFPSTLCKYTQEFTILRSLIASTVPKSGTALMSNACLTPFTCVCVCVCLC